MAMRVKWLTERTGSTWEVFVIDAQQTEAILFRLNEFRILHLKAKTYFNYIVK